MLVAVRNVVLFAVIVLFAVAVLQQGLERAERTECVQWIEQAEENPLFYLTDWQAEQCEMLEFNIDHLRR